MPQDALLTLPLRVSPSAKKNYAPRLTNDSEDVGQTTLIALPDIIGALGDLLKPEFSSFEAEQAMRCLHYLTNTGNIQHPSIPSISKALIYRGWPEHRSRQFQYHVSTPPSSRPRIQKRAEAYSRVLPSLVLFRFL